MNRSFILLVLCLVLITSSCEEKIQPSPSEAWTQLASMPTARSENAAAVVEHTIYVSGGFGGEQTLEAYGTHKYLENSRGFTRAAPSLDVRIL